MSVLEKYNILYTTQENVSGHKKGKKTGRLHNRHREK